MAAARLGHAQDRRLSEDIVRSRITTRPRLYYASFPYRSHQRVAGDYRRIIGESYDLIEDQDAARDAGIIVLHVEPRDYSSLYRTYPFLACKYVISCCVWEADDLPDAYKRSLSHVQEVWTCSRYCQSIIARHHPRVTYMPHVIDRDTACTDSDRGAVRAAIGYWPGHYYFLTLTRLWDRRKNTETLVRVFQRYSDAMPEARLIVKASPGERISWREHPNVAYLMDNCPDTHINALYELADAYVSAHHSEGWGLTLSDAMIFRKPVIATNYSGNLEFMSDANSFLVKCSVEAIRPADHYHLFNGGMNWAYIDEDHLGEMMVSLVRNREGSGVSERITRASADIQAFDHRTVGERIRTRLDQIVAQHL
jgi:glycosyltransferase involved in cell wall biosynthesis